MTEIRAWTWRHAIAKSDLEATTKHVLLTISLHMNEVGQGCYPTQEQLAKEASLTDRAVRKHIDIAVQSGWLTKGQHGFKGQKWRNNEYKPCWPDPLDTVEATQDVDEGEEPRSSSLPEGAEPHSSRQAKGEEPDDKKVRNHVPTSIPSNYSKARPRAYTIDNLQSKLLEAAGLSGFREERNVGLVNLAPIIGLIDAGYDFEKDILPAVHARCAGGFKPKSWSYFVEVVRDAAACRREIASQPKPGTEPVKWEAWCEVFFADGTWSNALGPAPGFNGCRAPAEIIAAAKEAAATQETAA